MIPTVYNWVVLSPLYTTNDIKWLGFLVAAQLETCWWNPFVNIIVTKNNRPMLLTFTLFLWLICICFFLPGTGGVWDVNTDLWGCYLYWHRLCHHSYECIYKNTIWICYKGWYCYMLSFRYMVRAFLDIIILCKTYGFPSPSFSESLGIIKHIYWLHNSWTNCVYPTKTTSLNMINERRVSMVAKLHLPESVI